MVDFEQLFENLPSPYMVLDRELRYVAMNRAYEDAVRMPRERAIGRTLFELFPDAANSQRLRESFERVFEKGEPHTLAFIPYEVPRSKASGGGTELRYWTAVHTPLKDESGQVRFLLQNTVDVTELRRLRDTARPEGVALIERAQEVEAAHRRLAEESAQFRQLFMQAPGFIAILSEPAHIFAFTNNAYLQLIGRRDVLGKPIREALPEIADQGFFELLDSVYASGEAFVGSSVSVRLRRRPEAEPEERFVDFVYQPIRDAEGEVSGIFVEGSDVTDRVRAQQQQRTLLDELNHRVKNTLANVQAIAAQTLRATPEPQAFRNAFEARLMALSATHNLLTASTWTGADLEEVVLLELKPHGANHYRLEGPAVTLSAQEALTFGLVFHELATNSAKYGALSSPDGCVRVGWSAEKGRLRLTWAEHGGPPITQKPERRGFGSRLIERSVRSDLKGKAELAYEPEGLTCRIDIRLLGLAG
ncbi:MAG TPA: PAS domain-containing protein [Caulobacteraceae bacterium]